jgi:O-methyltransferase
MFPKWLTEIKPRPWWLKVPASIIHAARAASHALHRDWMPDADITEARASRPDIPSSEMAKILAVEGLTMTGIENRFTLLQSIQYLIRHGIPGSMVECGVWHGGSMALMARELISLGDLERDLYLFDTFEGMPSAGDEDMDWRGIPARQRMQDEESHRAESHMWCVSPLETVQKNMAATGYPLARLHFMKGRVEDTLPSQAPQQIALLRLDTDWYESTRHELLHLYHRVVPGGVVIIDDYGYWQGARKAVDEFLSTCPDPILLHRIDETARVFVKPLLATQIASSHDHS